MMIGITCLIFGFVVGYLYRHSKSEPKQEKRTVKSRNVYLSYNERQRAKISYFSDAERIRQLNLLSPNESRRNKAPNTVQELHHHTCA